MSPQPPPEPSAEGRVVMPCDDLDKAVADYTAVGFVLQALGPADDPDWAELAMPGVRLLLEAGPDRRTDGPYIRIDQPARAPERADDQSTDQRTDQGDRQTDPLPQPAAAPDGVELAAPRPVLVVPDAAPTLAVQHETAAAWIRGRAGMLYRDLIPDRYGGAYIASHIHVPTGGPVPDYVHHHDIAYQLIFCHRGWVRVVYQDQGPPFVMTPGDCVLQPPGIRHRVLESSDDLFVVEITCPATHRTNLDHGLALPTNWLEPNRRFGGQRFVRHIASDSRWTATTGSPIERQETGVAAATSGLASARLLRPAADSKASWPLDHDHDLRFLFLLAGRAELCQPDGEPAGLREGSSVAVPAGSAYRLDSVAPETRILEVTSTVPPT